MSTEDEGLLKKVNDSDKHRNILPDTQGHTEGGDGVVGKMKQHKWKIVAVVAVLLFALILGLTLGLKKKDDNGGGPTPPTPPAPINSGYNPYFIEEGNINSTKNKVSGVLSFNNTVVNTSIYKAKRSSLDDAITLTPKTIPIGVNNYYIKNVKFDFTQVDYKVTKLLFTDNDDTDWRFGIPSDVVGSKPDNSQMSMDMVGFSHTTNPFGFGFRSTRQADVINIDTTNSDFIMTDKFMQLDL
jgi:hypothetical protein